MHIRMLDHQVIIKYLLNIRVKSLVGHKYFLCCAEEENQSWYWFNLEMMENNWKLGIGSASREFCCNRVLIIFTL